MPECISRFPSLAAGRSSAARSCCATPRTLTSPVKTRAWGSCARPSGRPSRRGRRAHGTATGSGACGYKNASGRIKWLSRDPIGEEGGPNLYGFVGNDPISRADALGLCPAGTCDKWEITIDSVAAGGALGAVLWTKGVLRADESCCMGGPLEYSREYVYGGIGIGAGIDFSANIGVGAKKFTTPCISWSAHNGFGRVTAAGIGAIRTFGTMYITTPQTYLNITSPSWGIDASIITTVGYWKVQANSYQQQ